MKFIIISYDDVIEHYADLVYRIAMAHTKNQHDAEDIFQDVFVSLINHLNNIEDENHLKHWLIRATLNRCKNHFKTFWKRKVVTYGDFYFSNLTNSESESEHIAYVRYLVNELSQKYRNVVYLYYFEDYSIEEIASILEIATGTVKSRLYTARKILGNELIKGGYHEI